MLHEAYCLHIINNSRITDTFLICHDPVHTLNFLMVQVEWRELKPFVSNTCSIFGIPLTR